MAFADFIAAIIEIKGDINEEMLRRTFKAIAGHENPAYITKQQIFDAI